MPNNESTDRDSFRLRKILRYEEQIFKFHQFLREQCFDFQNKFDHTVVFVSSGAIVLSYSLFDTAKTRALWVCLFIAMMLWTATLILSLWECIRNINKASQYSAEFSLMCITALRQHTGEDAVLSLQAAVKSFNKKHQGNLINGLNSVIFKIRKENKPLQDQLKKTAEQSFLYHLPNTRNNVLMLLLLLGGCVAFAFFTYLKRGYLPSTESTIPSENSQASRISETTSVVKIESAQISFNSNSVENAEQSKVEDSLRGDNTEP